MIYIDPREGSKQLIPILGNMGAPVQARTMPFGDAAFDLEGPDGIPVPVGFELKKPGDVLACISTKRFAGHQLPGMYRTYKVRYLMIDGEFGKGDDGLVSVPPFLGAPTSRWYVHPARVRYYDFMEWLTGIEIRAGFKLRFARDTRDAAQQIFAAYVYGAKAWEAHESFNVFHEPEEIGNGVIFKPIELRRRFAALLPDIGWKKSESAALMFPSVAAMVNAKEEDWAKLQYGTEKRKMKISIETAKKIVRAIWGS